MAECIVVDSNVFAVAEGLHADAAGPCQSACLEVILQVEQGQTIAVDAGDVILQEYLTALQGSGTAGLCAKLATRLWRTRHDPSVCRPVQLTPLEEPPGSFEEVPEPLRDFDLDDQPFLGVAAAEGSHPPLFAGVDREWWKRRDDLNACGLLVQFPCSAYLLELERQ